MRTLIPFAVALALAAAPAAGQCYTSASFQAYGTGCNPVFLGQVPNLNGRFDATNCIVYFQVTAFSGCCNTFLQSHVLALGIQRVQIPLPQIGAGCELLVDPLVLQFQPASQGGLFSLVLPPGLPPFTLVGQGAAVYFTTIGLSTDFALTPGMGVALQ